MASLPIPHLPAPSEDLAPERAGAGSAWDGVRNEVLAELANCRRSVGAVIDQSIQLSEAEVFYVANEVVGLREDARANIGDLETVVAQFREGKGEATVIDLIREQSRTCERFVRESSSRLQEQNRSAVDSLALTSQIERFARKITEISAGVKVLTLNANIESVRAGTAGRAFAAIAGRLRELSGEIESANKSVQQLAESLGAVMPKIADNAREMIDDSRQFSEVLVAQLGEFEASYAEAQRCVERAVGTTHVRSERIVARSYDVLSHLQFQDRMAQDLAEIKRLQEHSERVVATFLQRTECAATGADELLEPLRRTREATERAMSRLGEAREASVPLRDRNEGLLF